MKLISLLVALLIMGLLVSKQLSSSSSEKKLEQAVEVNGVELPKVPSSPKDLDKFEKDLNQFIQNNANERAKELE